MRDFLPNLYLTPPQGVTPSEFREYLDARKKWNDWTTVWWKNYDNTLSHFHTIPACHGQTDGQTDRQNYYNNIARQHTAADAR